MIWRIELFKGGFPLTVQQDLQKAVAAATCALGTYSTFSLSTQDQSAKTMFEELTKDAQRHVSMLNGRLAYIEQNNPMNQQTT
jgi:rubrerythrin